MSVSEQNSDPNSSILPASNDAEDNQRRTTDFAQVLDRPASLTAAAAPVASEDIEEEVDDDEEDSNPKGTDSQNARKEKSYFFGMKKKGFLSQPDATDDYEQRFPEDPMFEETGPNARVWRTYLVESAAFDENMIGEARDGLDAMLVFVCGSICYNNKFLILPPNKAGLFSAVVTSFLVQTSQNLQLSSADVSASLLYELIAVQRAAATGGDVSAVPISVLNPGSDFHPSTINIWINGLWVVSLALALVIALAAVLVKQWLHHYVAIPSGSPKDRSHIRQFRYDGFEKWQVLSIIGLLPVIMHLSLGLFFLGLVLFLIPLELDLAYVIGSFTIFVYALYTTSNILPIFFPQCPYQTPLTDFLLVFGTYAHLMVSDLQKQFQIAIHVFKWHVRVNQFKTQGAVKLYQDGRSRNLTMSLKSLEKSAVDSNFDILSVNALHWLFRASSNHSVSLVVTQAIGGLPMAMKKEVSQVFDDLYIYLFSILLDKCTIPDSMGVPTHLKPGTETFFERVCRTTLFLQSTRASLQLLFETEWTPEQILTLLSSFGISSSDMNDIILQKHVLSHYNIPHHPLVWLEIIKGGLRDGSGVFEHYYTDPKYFKMLIPAIWLKKEIEPGTPLLTMIQTISMYFADEFWQIFAHLHHIPPLLSYPISPSPGYKVLMHTLNLALDLAIADPTSPFPLHDSSWHWSVIGYFLAAAKDQMTRDLEWVNGDFLFPWLSRLIEYTSICEVNCPTRLRGKQQEVVALYRCLMFKENITNYWSYPSFEPSSLLRPQALGLFRRAIRGSIHDLSDSLARYWPIAFEAYTNIFHVLLLALENQSLDAFQIILEYDSLRLLGQCYYANEPTTNVIDDQSFLSLHRRMIIGYINRLLLVKINPTVRGEYIDYLYQHDVLRLCALCCVPLLGRIINHEPQLPVEKLVWFCSDASKLRKTMSWLNALSHWIDSNASAQWLKPYYVIGPEEDHNMLKQSFVNHGLGEPWMLSIVLSMIGWAEPWTESTVSLQLRELVSNLDNCLMERELKSQDDEHGITTSNSALEISASARKEAATDVHPATERIRLQQMMLTLKELWPGRNLESNQHSISSV
ncbi:hypothetical protein J3R30DRAFT_3696680 [Lentinula aciculospora]|uniref:DUF6535 domain-containing protein n=1 Tax=Lentinula aciculospora TaxID=153920 RepID=A0A9W9ALQ0_9AGAR|nr:hypothetical protein J3R30DRAFT_3696680 [Lentinula aciculospora]